MELTRYVHLNPLRAKLVSDIKALGNHPYSGIEYFMGRVAAEWQSTGILGLFGDKVSVIQNHPGMLDHKNTLRYLCVQNSNPNRALSIMEPRKCILYSIMYLKR